MITFTKALDKHIDTKRIPYNFKDNSITNNFRTATKEDLKPPKKHPQNGKDAIKTKIHTLK